MVVEPVSAGVILAAAILLLAAYLIQTVLLELIPTMKKEYHWFRLAGVGYALAFGLLVGQLFRVWA